MNLETCPECKKEDSIFVYYCSSMKERNWIVISCKDFNCLFEEKITHKELLELVSKRNKKEKVNYYKTIVPHEYLTGHSYIYKDNKYSVQRVCLDIVTQKCQVVYENENGECFSRELEDFLNKFKRFTVK